jgi:hypothetical protein
VAPLGTRAIIYEDSDTKAPWAPHGLDMWYLGSSKDHYQCHIYYVPETKGYRVSGSAELFPQHCSEPTYSPDSHIKELLTELQENMSTIGRKTCTVNVLKLLAQHLEAYIMRTPPPHWKEDTHSQCTKTSSKTPRGVHNENTTMVVGLTLARCRLVSAELS